MFGDPFFSVSPICTFPSHPPPPATNRAIQSGMCQGVVNLQSHSKVCLWTVQWHFAFLWELIWGRHKMWTKMLWGCLIISLPGFFSKKFRLDRCQIYYIYTYYISIYNASPYMPTWWDGNHFQMTRTTVMQLSWTKKQMQNVMSIFHFIPPFQTHLLEILKIAMVIVRRYLDACWIQNWSIWVLCDNWMCPLKENLLLEMVCFTLLSARTSNDRLQKRWLHKMTAQGSPTVFKLPLSSLVKQDIGLFNC